MYEITRQRRFNKTGFILGSLILLLLVGAFFGCQFLQPKTNPSELSDQMPLYRRIGILKSLGGVRTSNSGTHLLQLDNGETILLKSLQVNLEDPAYLGKTVEVRGIMTYTTDKKQIMEVMNIDLVQQETDTTVTETSWKDFQSEDLGFSVKYRDDLKVDEKNGSVIFSKESLQDNQIQTAQTSDTSTSVTAETAEKENADKNLHSMSISREGLLGEETVYTKAGLKNGESDLLASGVSKSRVGAGSYDALKKTDGNSTIYFIEAGKYVYIVRIEAGSDQNTLSDQNLFYEMIGNFKLTADQGESTEVDKANNPTPDTEKENGTTEQDSNTKVSATSQATALQQIADKAAPETAEEDTSVSPKTTEVSTLETSTSETNTTLEGYEKLESESFKFTMLYPKSWYYSGSAGTDSSVIRHYEFGSKPLEETPGDVTLDLMSGSMPSGSTSSINGKDVTITNTSSGVVVYVKGSGSRIYKFSGPSSEKDALLNMAASVSD